MRVEEFIDPATVSWNIPKLQEFLQPFDVDQVLKIKLSRFAMEDKLVWPFTKDLQYTVKSGYWTATHCYYEGAEIQRPDGSLVIKRDIWRLNILPKIKQFLWRAVSGALSTYTQLCMKGINIDPTCQRCCQEDETINHILFICPHASAVWRCSGILLSHVFSSNLEDNIKTLFEFMRSMPENENTRLLGFWNLWILWKSRNEFIFNKRNAHPIEDVRRAIDSNMEWYNNVSHISERRVSVVKSSQWVPPPRGWIKCNFDYSSCSDNLLAGIGWIIRDDEGKFLGGGCVQVQKMQTSLEGEALGFLIALQQTWIRGWRRIWFEGDNKQLCDIINQVKEHVDLGNLLCDIRHWMARLPDSSLDYVNRERNQAADAMARQAVLQDYNYEFCNIPPVWLVNFLYYPFTI